jgi:hypothetical protein
VKMMAKVELPNPRLLGEYIGEGSTGLEGNRDIKLLSFWHIFFEKRPYGPYEGAYGLYALRCCGK